MTDINIKMEFWGKIVLNILVKIHGVAVNKKILKMPWLRQGHFVSFSERFYNRKRPNYCAKFGRGILVRICTFPTWEGPRWKFVYAGNFQDSAQGIRLASSLCALNISLMVNISCLPGRCWYLMWKPVLQQGEHLLSRYNSCLKPNPIIMHVVGKDHAYGLLYLQFQL